MSEGTERFLEARERRARDPCAHLSDAGAAMERPDYLDAWFNTVNWDEVNRRFEQAQRNS